MKAGSISEEPVVQYGQLLKSPIPGQGFVTTKPARANIIEGHTQFGSGSISRPGYSPDGRMYRATYIPHDRSMQLPNSAYSHYLGANEHKQQLHVQNGWRPTSTDSYAMASGKTSLKRERREAGLDVYDLYKSEVHPENAHGVNTFDHPGGAASKLCIAFVTEFEEHYLRNNRSAGRKNMRCFPSCCQLGHKELGFCGGAIEVSLRLSPNAPRVKSIDTGNLRVFIELRVIPGNPSMTPQQYGGLGEANISEGTTYTQRYIESLTKTTAVLTRPLFEARPLPLKTVLHAQARFEKKAALLAKQGGKATSSAKPSNDALATLAALASTEPSAKTKQQVHMMKADKPPIRKKRRQSKQINFMSSYSGPEARFYVRPRSWHYGWISNKHTHSFLHYVRAYLFEATGRKLDYLKCVAVSDSDTFVISSSKRWQQPPGSTIDAVTAMRNAMKQSQSGKNLLDLPTNTAKCYPVSTPTHEWAHDFDYDYTD